MGTGWRVAWPAMIKPGVLSCDYLNKVDGRQPVLQQVDYLTKYKGDGVYFPRPHYECTSAPCFECVHWHEVYETWKQEWFRIFNTVMACQRDNGVTPWYAERRAN